MRNSTKISPFTKSLVLCNKSISTVLAKADIWETPFLIQENEFLIGKCYAQEKKKEDKTFKRSFEIIELT